MPSLVQKFNFQKMLVVCPNGKYGYCKLGNKFDKIHLTHVCHENENCKEIYGDKRHQVSYFFFEKLRRCKFGIFCSYIHVLMENNN